ncbi:TetR/AcrR family transcriptional regulator [Kineosporia sp. NBRC 101731]|uniref:TetR/AcrR family transcriptional regulator n=1 Tax=Kineosporia sp. NBRC 101731 TaxID=3032199 RepID=UPI0024A5A715|nr:TetR/AcrR family transcriptional regulator [Kineosporia sp. NBRC 101731]GLY30484.1 TetR family transcriptional regulator [Kineosporia sp. NBRC 101731]
MPESSAVLRRDAERNRQLLLRTASDLMAEAGLQVSYEDIARAAGTGMGTVYRRFPQRQDLIDALFSEHVDMVMGLAEEAALQDDAWAGLVWFLERQLEREAAHRGLSELLRGREQSSDLVVQTRARMTPIITDLIARAVRAEQLPPGVVPGDFVAVHLMVGSILDASRAFDPDLWRRALQIGLAGLRHADLPDPAPGNDIIDRLYGDYRK